MIVGSASHGVRWANLNADPEDLGGINIPPCIVPVSSALACGNDGSIIGFNAGQANCQLAVSFHGPGVVPTDITPGPGNVCPDGGIFHRGYGQASSRAGGLWTGETTIYYPDSNETLRCANRGAELLAPETSGRAINNAGFVVGHTYQYAPIVFEPGSTAMLNLPAAGTTTNSAGGNAEGINDAVSRDAQGNVVPNPEIVGAVWAAGFADGRAAYWRKDLVSGQYVCTDLNGAIAPGQGWHLDGANAVNDAGAIVGGGTFTDPATPGAAPEGHGFLLVPVELDKVSFYGTDGYHDVWQDKGVPYTYPAGKDAAGVDVAEDEVHWDRQSPQPRRYPFCYESGKRMKAHFVRLAVRSNWPKNFPNLLIRGVGDPADRSVGYDFTATPATFKDGIIEAKDLPCVKAFPVSTVDYFGAPDAPATAPDNDEPLRISWQLSTDGGTTWSEVGMSQNPVFVTLNKPLVPLLDQRSIPDPNYRLYRTVLYLACKHRGATVSVAALLNTWNFFQSLQLTTWDGLSLFYYKQPLVFDASLLARHPAQLLLGAEKVGAGNCYAFGQLFQDALWANGIENQGVEVTTKRREDEFFLIKDWTFLSPGDFGSEPPYEWGLNFSDSIPSSSGPLEPEMVPAPTSPNIYGNLASLDTIKGQNTNPPSEKLFGKHYIVQQGPFYYDPSYGKQYVNESNFEAIAIEGYAERIQSDTPPGSSRLILRVRKPDSGVGSIPFDPVTVNH